MQHHEACRATNQRWLHHEVEGPHAWCRSRESAVGTDPRSLRNHPSDSMTHRSSPALMPQAIFVPRLEGCQWKLPTTDGSWWSGSSCCVYRCLSKALQGIPAETFYC